MLRSRTVKAFLSLSSSLIYEFLGQTQEFGDLLNIGHEVRHQRPDRIAPNMSWRSNQGKAIVASVPLRPALCHLRVPILHSVVMKSCLFLLLLLHLITAPGNVEKPAD